MPQYLLNFAQSKIEAGQPTDAVPLIQRGLGILKQNAASSSSSVSKRSAFDRELKLKFESQLSRVQHLIDQTDMDTDSDSDEL